MHEMTKDLATKNITFKKEIYRSIFMYILFNDAVSSSCYIAANGRFRNKSEGTCNEAVMGEFEIKLASCFMVVYYCATLKIEAIIPPKRRLTFIGPHGVIFQKLPLFIITAVRIPNPVLF
jgi:hypothetical protein